MQYQVQPEKYSCHHEYLMYLVERKLMCGKQGGRGNVLLAWARFVSPWCQTCPSAIHIAYTLYIHYTSCTYIALEIADTVLHLSVFTLLTLQVNILYTLLYIGSLFMRLPCTMLHTEFHNAAIICIASAVCPEHIYIRVTSL